MSEPTGPLSIVCNVIDDDTGGKMSESMTYREIKEYIEAHDVNFEDDFERLPRGVQRWLTHEVLPTIRKTGAYEFPPDRLLDEIDPYTMPPFVAHQI